VSVYGERDLTAQNKKVKVFDVVWYNPPSIMLC